MALLHGVGAHLALVSLRCPHCGETQARSRHPDKAHAYRCRACHRLFDRAGRPTKPARAKSTRP